MVVHRLTKDEARRIAVHAQLLDAPRPTDLVDIVDRLTLLQIDPTAIIAPSADLVLWSRLGSTYDPADLTKAIECDRTLVETVAYIRSPRDVPAVIAEVRDASTYAFTASWLETNEPFRRDILALLGKEGPLLSRDIPDTSVAPWPSSGWTNNRNVTKMLESLALRGHVAISGRKGRQRYWDLPERVYPAGLPILDLDAAVQHRNERRLAALGIARSSGPQMPGEPPYVGDAGEEAYVTGIPGSWRVHPAYVGLPFEGRTALLSPFDRLIHDRVRAAQLFDFEYLLEMYKPKDKRRWGYFALPVLHGDRLVGKLDATADRKAGTLVINAIHEDVHFTEAMTAAVRAEIDELAAWLGLEVTGV
ncbi:crosslink repair DNA glycosylase YcaQ family protein [Micromonospora sp. WMMD812]|uniref:DNA glycosylase AlkZ-like family protein n=1 Tax=Micromonospora sp. WMMD812 TaxID=3015152 RepID=UPI00248D2D55|nr:crosslink repair DNA glycosylase YcaQ family protein [Micromonospora sp. WMMD812]WBB67586.1 winged helix DNA-binding domain-containing protein [Micromonospora sp. WMMD812]